MTLAVTQTPKQTKSIMRRVYVIWFLKRATRPALVRFYIFVIAIIEITSLVSLPDVVSNASPYDAPHLVTYLGQSLLATELVVQGMLLLIILGGAFMVRDIFHVRKDIFDKTLKYTIRSR